MDATSASGANAMRREDVSLATWCGTKIRALRVPFDPVSGSRVTWYRPMDNEPWDMIAWRHYHKESLWYIIADVNGVSDPFIFPRSTERIAIPPIF